MFANVEHVALVVPPLQFYRCRPHLSEAEGGRRGLMFVKYGNSEIALWVSANHTIDQVKAEIWALFGIPSDHQHHCYAYYPQVRRPARRTIHLEENMFFVRHLVADELKGGFSFKLVVTEQKPRPRYRIMRKMPATNVEHCQPDNDVK